MAEPARLTGTSSTRISSPCFLTSVATYKLASIGKAKITRHFIDTRFELPFLELDGIR